MWFDPYKAMPTLEGGTLPPSDPKSEAPDGLAQLARIARTPTLKPEIGPMVQPDETKGDVRVFLDHLARNGPSTYGAAAIALGWGATRAWQAEARLRAAGLSQMDKNGIHRL